MKLRKGSSDERRESAQSAPRSDVTTQSRTMMLARSVFKSPTRKQTQVAPHDRHLPDVPYTAIPGKQMTSAEQYWAARALTAEAILTVKTSHHLEIRQVTLMEEQKRAQEIADLHRIHEVRQNRLERLAIFLLATFFLFVFSAIVYLCCNQNQSQKERSRPMHFTIPILSPFASVVEHETSVLGTRMLTIITLISAVLLYMCFRHFLSRRGR